MSPSVGGAASSWPSAQATASACTSAASPATDSSRLCASIARTSTVPSFGLGRMSHHRYV